MHNSNVEFTTVRCGAGYQLSWFQKRIGPNCGSPGDQYMLLLMAPWPFSESWASLRTWLATVRTDSWTKWARGLIQEATIYILMI